MQLFPVRKEGINFILNFNVIFTQLLNDFTFCGGAFQLLA